MSEQSAPWLTPTPTLPLEGEGGAPCLVMWTKWRPMAKHFGAAQPIKFSAFPSPQSALARRRHDEGEGQGGCAPMTKPEWETL